MYSFLNSFLSHLPGLAQSPGRIVAGAANEAAKKALEYVLAELPELLVAAMVTTASGQVLASYTSTARRLTTAASAWAAVAQQLQLAQLTQGQPLEQLEEVVTSAGSQLHLLRVYPGGQNFLYVAVDLHDTNLALAREVMNQTINLLLARS